MGGTAEACAAQMGCCSLAVLEQVTWSDLAGTHWPVTLVPSLLHPSCCNSFSLPGNEAEPSAYEESPGWLGGLQQRLLIFKISLWLCIPLSNSYYLSETIFLEALSCWEETSCCGQ